jgi:hypothetical protein
MTTMSTATMALFKAGDTCYVRARNGALMREGKALSSNKLKELPARATVRVVAAPVMEGDAERVQIESDGIRGWVSTKVLSDPQTGPRGTGAPGEGKLQTTLHYREGTDAARHHSLKLTIPPRWVTEKAPLRKLCAAFCDNYSKKHPAHALDADAHRLCLGNGSVLSRAAMITTSVASDLYVVPEAAALKNAPLPPPPTPAAAPPPPPPLDGGVALDIPRRAPQPAAKRATEVAALMHDAKNCYDLDECDDVGGGAVVDLNDAKTTDAKAAALKDKGNKQLAAKNFAQAAQCYDDALSLVPPPVGRLAAVLLANRAQALLSRAAVADGQRLDRPSVFAALRDAASNATEARAADETYDKAWYRLGLANLELAKRCAGGGYGAPLPDEVATRLKDAVKALAKTARLSPKVKAMREAHRECKAALELTEAQFAEARLPACYAGVPPVVGAQKALDDAGWIDCRAACTIPVSRLRSGVVERTVELPVLLAKRWNRNNNGELAVSMTVSDHCGTPYVTSAAEALGPAWTVGEGLYAGKKWKGGFLSIPDRTGVLKGLPKHYFLLHPSVVDAGQLERLVALGLVEADVRPPVEVQMDAAHDAIPLRIFACSF